MRLMNIFKKQGGFQLIKQYCRSGVLGTAICEFLLLGKSKTALEILRLSTQFKTKKRLEKKYKSKLDEIDLSYKEKEQKNIEKIVWICWLQGMEQAPSIVKRCYQSIVDNIKDRKIILITEKNYRQYIKFPYYIQKKIDKNIIKGAHMTDLLRLELLLKYGGTWIDATVFCTNSNIPEYMLDSELFLFQCLKPGRDGHSTVISNWFITAKSNNRILYATRELLYIYWKENNNLYDYFIFHIFFEMAIEKYQDEWKKVVPVSNSTPHILLLCLFEKYDDEMWNAITKQSVFNKLTYKFSEKEIKQENTYYRKIMGDI